ncbi:MAG TPA: 5'/3'-nucleotidase SurE [Kiloniellaceae bacterium]|nr:5'/3'-nucleotidase SurE [Kiloniellaceae bacterium]HIP77751.1 5'/3'-nucleotidase SurE [Kiloniellaceae bacterium]
MAKSGKGKSGPGKSSPGKSSPGKSDPGKHGIDLKRARILVTNDDGINAPGLKVLVKLAKTLSEDVWVVAPESEQSATSHSLTLRRPLRERQLGTKRFSVDGTPTDCVLVAHHRILADRLPDLVLSGINDGGNLAEDVTYSGTIAATMEAALLGIPAIAFSQQRGQDGIARWKVPETFLPDIVRRLAPMRWTKDLLVNVNFPAVAPEDVTGIEICRQGRRDEGTTVSETFDPSGRRYLWIGGYQLDTSSERDSDLAVTAKGGISITPLHLDLTHRASMKSLRELFG